MLEMGTRQMLLTGFAAFSLGAAGLYIADRMTPGTPSRLLLIASVALMTSPALLVGFAAHKWRTGRAAGHPTR